MNEMRGFCKRKFRGSRRAGGGRRRAARRSGRSESPRICHRGGFRTEACIKLLSSEGQTSAYHYERNARLLQEKVPREQARGRRAAAAHGGCARAEGGGKKLDRRRCLRRKTECEIGRKGGQKTPFMVYFQQRLTDGFGGYFASGMKWPLNGRNPVEIKRRGVFP